MTIDTKTKPLLGTEEIKDMIRRVVNHQGLDAFHADEDIRFRVAHEANVNEDDVTDDDVQRVRDLYNRARVAVTFGRNR